MTERDPSHSRSPRRRRRSLYRSVLSVAVAAIVAAWLPFSVMYVTALHKHSTTVSAITQPGTNGSARVITTASGATRVVAANPSAANTSKPVLAATTTRAS